MDRRKSRSFVRDRLYCLLFLILIACTTETFAQPKPPASGDRRQKVIPIVNRFQISFFSAASYNIMKGQYDGVCPCSFVQAGSGWSFPVGLSFNIPFTDDASIYLRASVESQSLAFESARKDTLRSIKEYGEMTDDLTIESDLIQFDLLLRLIAEEQGVRLLAGPSFGFSKKSRARILETELKTGVAYTVEDGDLQEERRTRYGFIFGIEYAFIPIKGIYIIPALIFRYGMHSISNAQSLRLLNYTLNISLAYQF